MSKTKRTRSRRCAVPSGWPGLIFIIGGWPFRTLGYVAFIAAGVFVSNQTGFFWYAASCFLGHGALCFAEVIERTEEEKPDGDDSANTKVTNPGAEKS